MISAAQAFSLATASISLILFHLQNVSALLIARRFHQCESIDFTVSETNDFIKTLLFTQKINKARARAIRSLRRRGSNPATPATKSLVYQRFQRFTRGYNFVKKTQKMLKFIIYADNPTDNFSLIIIEYFKVTVSYY